MMRELKPEEVKDTLDHSKLTAFATQRARLGETVGLSLHDLWSFHDPEGEVLMARAMAEA